MSGDDQQLDTGAVDVSALEADFKVLLTVPRHVSKESLGSDSTAPGSETPSVDECSQEGQLDVESNPVILTDVKPHAEDSQSDPAMFALLAQARQLGQECFKDKDCLSGCSKRGGWHINLLAEGLDHGAAASLLGFVIYRLKPDVRSLSVYKLAVPEQYRRHGYGKLLMLELAQQAKQTPDIDRVSLASLAGAISFYQRLGFKRLHTITEKDATDTAFPGQVYMELRTRGGAQAPKGKKNRKR
eukprot:TRINITY_DN21113_c0_g1_i1.p1 TRINITY_DN21113_c0_g1~~TRINITY_DN21113_c0_g1_i1.p1  ORF type:complete len:243 (-),score=55.88 TRINITY_DN21113_c0_g1_i1:385-1113(-)